ncbi:type II toxin-antitoxin system prevent-host-death family antitoxin [Streptomyces sp. NPDC004539]|uniref:type II toxin-antitoxin system prevent-host-death family antitoxin n=1 Tax=Streptomyces sp. NPDC004539 TaxID=3154280 RepID=UPI0033ADAAED
MAEVVERADHDDVPTVITRRGEEVTAVVSIDERMADPAHGIPIEDITRETLARSE